jgi:alcohol dehydrogenase, propanol-preferring
MHAMVLKAAGGPLEAVDLPLPNLGPGQVLVRVHACGVCRTDLHVVDGELADPKLPLVWGERVVRSVANLTRRDGEEFLALAPRVPVRTSVQTFPLAQANVALANLREGRIRGAAVLEIAEGGKAPI